jgi:undecaprenyl-diphosphatase
VNYSVFQLINDWAAHYDWIDDFMEFCAQDIVWILLAVLALLWLTGKASNQKVVFYACLSAVVSLLLASFLIAPEVNHPRPFVSHTVHQLIAHASDASFPSDHATMAFSVAFGVWFSKKRTGWLLLALATLTGIARVYVGL